MDEPQDRDVNTATGSGGNINATSTSKKSSKRNISPSAYHKACTLCAVPANVLVRCQIENSGIWHFVCPGKCWKQVSGGIIDGDETHPHYKYGGMWKNKHAGVSAKKPKGKKMSRGYIREWSYGPEDDDKKEEESVRYTRNDRVLWEGKEWVCRRGHSSVEKTKPGVAWTWWKEVG